METTVIVLALSFILFLVIRGALKFRRNKQQQKKKYPFKLQKPQTLLAYEVLHELNELRGKNNVAHLKMDALLNKMANQRASKLAIKFTHDGVGNEMNKVLISGLNHVAECVGKNHTSAVSLINALNHSKKHKKIMLSGRWHYVGVGIDDAEANFSILFGYDAQF